MYQSRAAQWLLPGPCAYAVVLTSLEQFTIAGTLRLRCRAPREQLRQWCKLSKGSGSSGAC